MSEATRKLELVAAALAEADAVATLHRLNAEYIQAFAGADSAWHSEHLSDDFAYTLADGRRINKSEFLRRIDEAPTVNDVTSDDVDVHPLGDVALVHGVTHFTREGAVVSTRYTAVWRFRDGRWQTVAAQVKRMCEQWDLVDTSAPPIVGAHLLHRPREIIRRLAIAIGVGVGNRDRQRARLHPRRRAQRDAAARAPTPAR
jgi:ketosteroid isomerase-like protein